ncbi:mucin-2-like isoform X2 [Limanda limanda]|uniref:mucin-2-like isoform X2 n=1 Tax=Limanda limanda TaxID=27771 RepID=UPI0029C9703D|nr:mucin-2-like isoform X2 [Limanda limanda]
MKMKMKLLFVSIVMVMMSVPGVTTFFREPTTTSSTWTTARPAVNLNGKMFTLSSDGGGISFYPPSTTTPTPETTTEWTTTNYETTTEITTTPENTPTPETTTEWTTTNYETTTTPRTTPLSTTDSGVFYSLTWDGYYSKTFKPNVQFWPGGFSPDIWTRVCVTMDSVKNVGQVFSGSNMSVRKRLRYPFPQGQEPVINVPGFDGQLTDVQMWDYPLNYREIIQYMSPSTYGPSRGSVLTWSHISYSLNEDALLEDTYEI